MYKHRFGTGSSVGIATGYRLDGPGIDSRWGEISRTCPDRPWGPPSLLYNGHWVFLGGRKRPGRDADPSLHILVPRSKNRVELRDFVACKKGENYLHNIDDLGNEICIISYTCSWFHTFTVFWILYVFFRVIDRRLKFKFQRFGTLCSIFIRGNAWIISTRLWRWNRQSVPKRWHLN
jgi:hypothetical protein